MSDNLCSYQLKSIYLSIYLLCVSYVITVIEQFCRPLLLGSILTMLNLAKLIKRHLSFHIIIISLLYVEIYLSIYLSEALHPLL